MPLVRGYTDDIRMLSDNIDLNSLRDEHFNITLDKIGFISRTPLLLRASFPPDSLLHIGASIISSADGGGKSVPPIENTIPTTVETTIDFQTGATTGQTVLLDGGVFSLPASTAAYYRRFALVLRSDGTIDTAFSDEYASFLALPNAGDMFASLVLTTVGYPIGWVDLICDDALGKFRTAGSSSPIIENMVSSVPRIHRLFGSGGAGETAVWNTLVKTSAYLLMNYDEVFADSSSSGFILTLPASAELGDRVQILDMKGTWELNNVTVSRNGNNIAGIAEDFILDVNNAGVLFIFDGIDNWVVYRL